MKPHESREKMSDAELRARLSVLQNAPPPNLQRGRARVLAAAQQRIAEQSMPRRLTFALALGIGLAVILVMVVMSSAMGALPIASVALTRTDTAQTLSPAVIPANALTRAPKDVVTRNAPRTPIPNAVPEPPRSPAFLSTQTVTQ